MDLGGPIVAGSGGEDVIEWGRLKSLNVRTLEVVVIGRVHEARQPFYSMQTVTEDGVRVDFETKVGGTRGAYASTKRKMKMPEDTDRFVLNYEGKRYICWRGGWGPPPGDPPGSVADGGTPGQPGEPGSGVPGSGGNPPGAPGGGPAGGTPPGAGSGAGSLPVPDPAGGMGAGEVAAAAIPGAADAPIRIPTLEEMDPRPRVKKGKERRDDPPQDGPTPPPVSPQTDSMSLWALSVIPSAWSMELAWQLPGILHTDIAFEAPAIHQTLGACCVNGRITDIESDLARGIRLTAAFGAFSVSLTAFEGFDGSAEVTAEFCNGSITGTQQVSLDVSIERLMTLTIRTAFLALPAGPLRFEVGLAGRIDHAQFQLTSGGSSDLAVSGGASTAFWGNSIGPVVQGRLKLGQWEAAVALEASLLSFGSVGPEAGRATIATGVVCRF